MKKTSRDINLLDISQTEYQNISTDKKKTTDINILLNRVKMTKKTEFKKRIIFSSLLLFAVIFVGIFSLI
jgi:hypothetical protein